MTKCPLEFASVLRIVFFGGTEFFWWLLAAAVEPHPAITVVAQALSDRYSVIV